MSDTASLVESLKELNDLEFEIVFIDSVFKKLKSVIDKKELRTESLLLIYMSIIETIRKYTDLTREANRSIPHEDAVNMIISKGENFLKSVANNESKAPYAQQSLSDTFECTKELLFALKKELTDLPKYSHLKSAVR
jgi:lantibiotic modifying enzyme